GGHVRLRFSDPSAYQAAASALREVSRDDEALSLQIPSDGSQRELRSILDWLDSVGIEADELTVHTPDLDDVFFALTGSNEPIRASLSNQLNQLNQSDQPNQPNQPKEAVR
ncbi:ABC transporter, partial [Streptomyces sp. AA8]|nr:ABC transporter [Streptomyces telluris]